MLTKLRIAGPHRLFSSLTGIAAVACIAGALAGCGNGRSDPPVSSASGSDPLALPTAGKPLPTYPPTTDGMEALRRMVKAYRSLDSAVIRSLAAETQTWGDSAPSQIRQTTTLKFQANPPRLSLDLQDADQGTQTETADGHTLIHYWGKSNVFFTRATASTLAGMASQVDEDAPQVMSPLLFLTSGDVPPGVASVRLGKDELVGGHRALVVEGQYTDAYMRAFGSRFFENSLQPIRKSFQLWLDPSDYTLLKTSVDIGWRAPSRKRTKANTIDSFTVASVETYTNTIRNPTFASEEFRFLHPRGVTEVFKNPGAH